MAKKTGKSGLVKRFTAAVLAGCMLYCGGMQVNAATLKDVFDEHYYADMYPDLKETYGYNREALWNHFVTHGLSEGRNMNGLIDIVKYRETYGDLDAAFGNNWDAYLNHYLTFGAKEHRDTGTSFNALDYAGRYEDLQAAYGTNVLALWKHYQAFGATEGREARDENVVQAEADAARAAEEESASVRIEREDWHGGYWIRVYDSNDILIKTEGHNKDGNCYMWWTYEYYESGHRKTATAYNVDGSVCSVTEYFDSSDEKISKETYY